MRSFRSEIRRPPGTGTWHYINIPFDAVAEFGTKGQIRVKGTVNGIPFRSTLLPGGAGDHYLVVGKELRDQAAAAEGDEVDVALELDDAPRQVELHPEFAAALAGHPRAKAAFENRSYSRQKLMNSHIAEAKREETRARRVADAIRELTGEQGAI